MKHLGATEFRDDEIVAKERVSEGSFRFVDSGSGFWKSLMPADGSFSQRRREANMTEEMVFTADMVFAW